MRSAPMLDFPLDEFEQRLGKLFDTLERTDCAAVLLTNVENLRYYCNFRTSAWNSEFLSPAMLVVARSGGIALVTSPLMKATALATCCLDESDILTFDGFGEAATPEVLVPSIVSTLEKLGTTSGKLGAEIGPMTRMRITYNDHADLFKALPNMEPADLSMDILALRQVKSPREIDIMRKNCHIAVDAFKAAVDMVVLGETTEEDFYHNFAATCFDLGADDFQLRLVVEFGPDRQQPNSVAGTRVYSDPDWCIYADTGPSLHGYISDMIRIAKLKPPTKPQRELYDIVHGCHEKLIPMVKPGLKIGELVKAQDAYMRAHGVDDICLSRSVSGHGLGQDVHEMPVIQQAYSDWEFKVGTVFAFEPTLIHPEHGQIVLENNYLVTENGCENLTPQLQDIYVPGLS